MTCPSNTICDHTLGSIPCSETNFPACPNAFIPVVTSCPLQDIQSTTSAPARTCDANKICASKSEGRFPYGTNCTQYVYCFMSQSAKAIKGKIITCPFSTLFDPATGDCKMSYTCPEVPASTPATSEPVFSGRMELLEILLKYGGGKYFVVVKPIE